MMNRESVNDAVACAIVIAVLAIIGALWVVVELVRLLMPVFVFIDFAGR